MHPTPTKMQEKPLEQSSTTGAVPLDVSLGPSLHNVNAPVQTAIVDRRISWISVLAIAIAAAATAIAQALIWLINLCTNLFFFGRWSGTPVAPWDHHLGPFVIIVPVIGALIVGVMTRWGSPAIRGHGIPEAMEQILLNESRIVGIITRADLLSAHYKRLQEQHAPSRSLRLADLARFGLRSQGPPQ